MQERTRRGEEDKIYEFAVTAMALAYSPTFFRLRMEHWGKEKEGDIGMSYSFGIDLADKCFFPDERSGRKKSPEALQELRHTTSAI